MSELWHSFLTNKDRMIHKWTHYFPIYERHFDRFKNTSPLILEIGCGQGGSLQMWKKYFGPNAEIVGIDIKPDCQEYEEDQIRIFIGDQSDPIFLDRLLGEIGIPDIVIDDGSHVMRHVNASFDFLYPQVSKNGVYLVEDMHAAYWPELEGGYLQKESFIERSKGLVDSLNAYHSRGAVQVDGFTRNTTSIHFYDSVVVFEKGIHKVTSAPEIGKKTE